MATATAFAAFATPPAEDTMDMSSPEKQDIDIDIDVTDYHTSDHVADDEQMVEDHDARPQTATDASMDEYVPHVNEEEMHDDIPEVVQQPYDEEDELIDYDDDDEDLTVVEPVNNDAGVVAEHESLAQPTDQDSALQQMPSDALQEYPEDDAVEEVPHESEEVGLEQSNNDGWAEETLVETEEAQYAVDEQHTTLVEATDETVGPHDESHAEHETGFSDPEHHAEPQQDPTNAEEEAAPQRAPNPLKTRIGDVESGPPTPTDTGLHPMLLYFKGQQMYLFKSKHQPNGLLKDDNLVSVSLAELIEKCKQRLVSRGEQFSQVQELVLSFDRLPLMVYESSRAAFSTSLNDILEIFLLLHRNDGRDPPPFYLTLTANLAFESSLAFLKEAAESGRGVLNVVIPDEGDDQQDEYYANRDAYVHEQYGDYEQEDGTDNDYHGERDGDYQGHEYTQQDEETYDDKRDEAEHPEENHVEEPNENPNKDSPVENQGTQEQGADGVETNKNEWSAVDDLEENAEVTEHPDESHGEEQPESNLVDDSTLDASAVSSVTVQGDEHTEPVAGDDDEALIIVEADALDEPGAELDPNAHPEETVQQTDEGTKEVPDEEEPLYDEEYDEASEDELIDYEDADHQAGISNEQQNTAPEDGLAPAAAASSPLLDEDHIDFDDDTTAEYEAKKASPPAIAPVGNSPAGKRSFQELDDEDDIDFDEPDLKKPRS